VSEVLLSATRLTKRFGGLAAVNEVSVDLWRERIHAVIGPNGAGKSTLTNLLSGDLPTTSGQITLAGRDVTGWSPERISRLGLGRSYQKTNIFPALHRLGKRAPGRTVARCGNSPGIPLRWLQIAGKSLPRSTWRCATRAIELAGLTKAGADRDCRHHQPR
jgi:branched-chain amino acid transport system ATP-binding protein